MIWQFINAGTMSHFNVKTGTVLVITLELSPSLAFLPKRRGGDFIIDNTSKMMYNSIASITMTNDETITNNDEEPPEEPTDESEDEEESDTMIVEHKEKKYIVADNIMYSIKKDGSKNKPVGTWNDGKVKKLPKNEAIDV